MELRRPPFLLHLLAVLCFLAAHAAAAAAVLGIDLGTEYFKAALVKPGIPLEIVLTKDSRRKDISVIAFKPSQAGSKDGLLPETIYGADAMAIAARFPGNVYPNLKTLLGLPVGSDIVREYAARHPSLHLRAHKSRGTTTFKPEATGADGAEEEAWMVEELLAMELQNIRKNAELTAGGTISVRSVVLTVPPFYTKEEQRALQVAAELAGLNVLSLINDGLAVGLNYATTRQFPKVNDGAQPEYHLVFDMGAKSTTATVMRFQSRSVRDIGKFNKTVQEVQVIGSGWDRTLGGDALNYLILDDMVAQFVESPAAKKISVTAEAVKSNGRAVAKLLKEAERLRQVLSANQNTLANFEGLFEDIDFKYKITRAEFEAMTEKCPGRAVEVIDRAIEMAAIKKNDLTSIILHGGASRTPFVQKALEDFAGSADKLRSNVNADEAAVFGAGFRAADISPSFRVKEIRVQDGPMYETGFTRQRDSAKPQRQRIWARTSPMGGPVKELTFPDRNDFALTFYEAVGTDDRDIKSFATKNLTATVAALVEQHPSCAESDVSFKLGVRLSPEDGEVQVVKAAVTCEVEASDKDGFVDGFKNLLGFGKKEQKPLADAGNSEEVKIAVNAEGKDTEAASSSSSSSTTPASSSAATAAKSGEKDGAPKLSKAAASTNAAPKAETKSKKTVSIPVDYALENAGLPTLTEEEWTKAKDKLKAFAASDKARAQREEALNLLEGYTYKVRDLLDGEAFVLRSTENERERVAELVSQTSDWLYGAGAEASKEELKSKLGVVQGLVAPIETRIEEAEKRPELIASLHSVMKITTQLVGELRKQITDFEMWQASLSASSAGASSSASSTPAAEATGAEFDGLEDDEKGKEGGGKEDGEKEDDVVREILARRPLYSKEEIEAFDSLIQSTDKWLQEQETRQAALDPAADAVLTFQALEEKLQALDKASKKLMAKQKAKTTATKKNNKGKDTKTDSRGWKKNMPFKDGDAAFDASMFADDGDGKLSDEQREFLKQLFDGWDPKKWKEGKAPKKQGEADDEAGMKVEVEVEAEEETEQKQEKEGEQGGKEKSEAKAEEDAKGEKKVEEDAKAEKETGKASGKEAPREKADIHDEL